MLIAAYHVFLRLSTPRHPPVALNILSLKNFYLLISLPIPYSIVKEPSPLTCRALELVQMNLDDFHEIFVTATKLSERRRSVGGGERD